ncbi:DUF7948 domain-containing protein [[Eubacterium] cellulosolvens]
MRTKFFSLLITGILFIQLSMIGTNSVNLSAEDIIDVPEIPVIDAGLEKAEQLLSNVPCAFTENHGQLKNDDVRFYDQGGSVWFTDDGVWFEFREYPETRGQGSEVTQVNEFRLATDNWLPKIKEYERVILKQEFMGANLVRPIGRERLSWDNNFFYGNDSSKWCPKVPNYGEVYYENLYDGIDLKYYITNKGLKYDFMVNPGGDIGQIKIKYLGAEGLNIDNSGNLIIRTQFQDLIDGGLFVYQDYDGERYQINCNYILQNDLEYGFELTGEYKRDEVVVIDPILEYSTYIGGTDDDFCYDIEVDSNGYAFVTGFTESSNFPTTIGANDTSYNNHGDVFVMKLNHNGSKPLYSTFVGGSNWECGWDLAIDTLGNAHVTGRTHSSDFTTTTGAFDTSWNGGTNDAFVFKLNPTGSTLLFSTYLGDTAKDYGRGIDVDPTGNITVAGDTFSSNFPTTPGAYCRNHQWGNDAFVLKLYPNGSQLVYSTFVGGNDDEITGGVSTDAAGNAYVITNTDSTNFPTSPGALYSSNNGRGDLVVFKINQNGSTLEYSTYIGGNLADNGYDIEVDDSGSAFGTGFTHSANFPRTAGANDTTHNGGSDVFVFKLNHNASKLIYSTFVGGTGGEIAEGVALDSQGNAYVSGRTTSTDFPITLGAINTSHKGNWDLFITMLNQSGASLSYSTYVGGNVEDWGMRVAVDPTGSIYATGETESTNFPTTPGAFDTDYSGWDDGFTLKISFKKEINITSVSMLKDNKLTTSAYSCLCPYTFQINITDTASVNDLTAVRLTLDPAGSNIQLIWDSITGQFYELLNPGNYVTLEPSSKVYNNCWYEWIVQFNLTFNWTYPDEKLNNIQAYATSKKLSPVWYNATLLYQVENDLEFNGTLRVWAEDNREIFENDTVRGGETLNWRGLTIIYENTINIFPPEDEFDIILKDETGNAWLSSPLLGNEINIDTITKNITDLDGEMYRFCIAGIPEECDQSNVKFTLRIDADNVTFSKPIPNSSVWQTSKKVITGISISDTGGCSVDGSSVMYTLSRDNGNSWIYWEPITDVDSGEIIEVQNEIVLEEGDVNLIKWCAKDTVGNGPSESEIYRIPVDTKNVYFSQAKPEYTKESPTQNVEVGIKISDLTSGVDADTISYKVSTDDGKTWGSWTNVLGLFDGSSVEIRLNLTFPNGTENRIKWRAADIAGNGPVESDVYVINVNTWLSPRTKLQTPSNAAIVTTTKVKLTWMLLNRNFNEILYDVLLDTINPPTEIRIENFDNTHFTVDNLSDSETYYWTIIPKAGTTIGSCVSGVWSFTINTTIPIPIVTLKSPANNAILKTLRPTLSWTVVYEGSETLFYNIYLDTKAEPEFIFPNHPSTEFTPDLNLKDGLTYYWKVKPIAGNAEGPESETRSFSIDTTFTPSFDFQLELSQNYVQLAPGENKTISAKVTNLAELADNILLNLSDLPTMGINIYIHTPILKNIEKNSTGESQITILINPSAVKGEVPILIEAFSAKAAEYEQVVKKSAILTVMVLEAPSTTEKPNTRTINDPFLIWMIICSIIIVIVALIIITFFILKKKKVYPGIFYGAKAITRRPQSHFGPSQHQIALKPSSSTPQQISGQPTQKVEISQKYPEQPTIVASPISEAKPLSEIKSLPQLPPANQSVEKSVEQQINQPTPVPIQPTVANLKSNMGKQ